MKRIILPSRMENLEKLILFVASCAKGYGFPRKEIGKIELAAEEILVNIIRYAYPNKPGEVAIECRQEAASLKITFVDWGIPFNPVSAQDPDTNLPLDARDVGGMGIFLVKKMIPEVHYDRWAGANRMKFVIPLAGKMKRKKREKE